MRKTLLFSLLASLLFCSNAIAEAPAKVMLMGTFHFANPGLDTVKTNQIDVTTPKNQQYLEKFSARIAHNFSPTVVLLECARERQLELNTEYNKYVAGDFKLPVNEIYQLGFRIAKASGLESVQCFDEREVQWQAGELMKTMPEQAPEIQAEFEAFISDVSTQLETMHADLSLKEILLTMNSREFDEKNQSLYVLLNEIGASESFVGADATASWWHRNFRMYANIQKAAVKDSRVFVIAGQGHTAILKNLLTLDPKRVAGDVQVLF